MNFGEGLSESPHALYISVIEIEISKSMEIEMDVKVFSDDLYSSMLSGEPSLVSLEAKWDKDEVSNYFASKIELKSGATPIPIILQEINIEGESTFLQFEGSLPSGSKDLRIQLGHFYELFPTQRNILKLRNGESQEHAIFSSAQQVNKYDLN